jgi:thymidylate synthase (FAD)
MSVEDVLDKYYPVLDQGWIRLVDVMGDDQAITEAARTSYAKTKRQTDRNLLRYLYRHLHTSPFEMVELKFHCKMPIFVARQWIRHRTANVNEMSGRYVEMPQEFYLPAREQIQVQSQDNKQGRGELTDDHVAQGFLESLQDQRVAISGNYHDAIESGIAKELARIDLPLSTYTQWYWKIDLHNLLHFLGLRFDPHAQWEIREYARIMAGMLAQVVPEAYGAWVDYRYAARRFSRLDLQLLHLSLAGELVTEQKAMDLGMTGREFQEYQSKILPPLDPPDVTLPEPIPTPGS